MALVLVLCIGLTFPGEKPIVYGDDGQEMQLPAAFHKWTTHRDTLRLVSVYGILACGMTVVIITAGIDLSVGSVLGLTAVCFPLLLMYFHWPPVLAVCGTLAIGTVCGLVSGGITAVFRIQPFIVTLAMMVFARGLAKAVTGGKKAPLYIQSEDGTIHYPPVVQAIRTRWFDDNLAVVTVVFLISALITWILLSRLRWGRYLYAIGGNEQAARLSGVPVAASKILAYALAGLFSAVAGICQAAQETNGDPEAGATYELTAIAIVVIGGTNLMGGSGGIGLTVLGALTIGYIQKILSINQVPEAWRLMLTGIIIVAAVLVQRRRA
ncbi:MAG: ABC transporter permease [Planctomycetes bacterium]|nr:ABC transporter permease [Planctomycetota bacterium]NOG56035.1 ABC transporter permease [Planctomycetota bacterium]